MTTPTNDNRGYVGIRCPKCGNVNCSVIDSRVLAAGAVRRRRSECRDCKYRFSTYEVHAAEYEKMLAMKVDEQEIDVVISTLRAIKAQFGDLNGRS